MCWHPLARKLQRSKKMNDTQTPQEAAESGLLQPHLVRLAFDALSKDISDRRGLKLEWTKVDDEVMKEEIRPAWEAIISECVRQHLECLDGECVVDHRLDRPTPITDKLERELSDSRINIETAAEFLLSSHAEIERELAEAKKKLAWLTEWNHVTKQALDALGKAEIGTLKQAVADTIKEREWQDARWGVQNHDPITWSAILTEECGEFAQAALHHKFGGHAAVSLRKEAVQVAAVAVAIIECLDRNSVKIGCALCDRGDGQLGHADNCPNREPDLGDWLGTVAIKTLEDSCLPNAKSAGTDASEKTL